MLGYTRAPARSPDHVEALLGRAEVHVIFGRVVEGVASFTRALELDPRSARAHAGSGRARYLLGDLEGAIADFDRALALAPTAPRTRSAIAPSCGPRRTTSPGPSRTSSARWRSIPRRPRRGRRAGG